MAGRAGEIERPGAAEEQRLAERRGLLLLRMRERRGEFLPGRLARHIGRDRAELLDRLAAARMRALHVVGGADALQLLHAPEDARLDVHHAVGVGEIARQLGERAVHLARSLAEIALLERHVLRAARRGPQRLAAIGIEKAGIAPRVLAQHLPVFLDRLFGFGILRANGRRNARTPQARPARSILESRVSLSCVSSRPHCGFVAFSNRTVYTNERLCLCGGPWHRVHGMNIFRNAAARKILLSCVRR